MDTATRDTPKSPGSHLATLIRMDNRRFGDAFNRALVDQLRAAAADSGKSYWDIADEAGISRATLARLFAVNPVARQSDLKVAYIYALCRVLDLDIVGIMARAEHQIRAAERNPASDRTRRAE